MKSKIKDMRIALIILFSSLFLQACGGSSNNEITYSISSDTSSVAFNNELLQEEVHTVEVNVTFNGEGVLLGFAPDSNAVNWLQYRISNVTATSATIHIDLINADILPANLYSTTLRLSSGDAATTNFASQDIDVSLLVWQTLTFDDTFGVESIAAKTINISSSADDLTLTSSEPWLSVEKTFADEITTITVTPDLSSFTEAGLYSAAIDITSPKGTTSYPVEISLDNNHLFADRETIALVETANVNNTQATVKINSNSVLPWGWQATTDATWLTLTTNLDTNELTISADGTTLDNNATATAVINVTANEQTIAIAEVIQVSFYKSDAASTNNTLDIVTNSNALVTHPLLPQYYVATNNELRRYHLYSNELLSTTVIAPVDTLLEQLVIHPNANIMFARASEITVNDENAEETIIHRYKINLTDMSFVELPDADITGEPTKFIRLYGRYFLVTSILEFADNNLMTIGFDANSAFFASTIHVAKNKQTLFALDVTVQRLFKRLTAKVNDFGRNPISTEITHSYRPASLAEDEQIRDFYVTSDEQNIYAISPSSEWVSFDGTTFTDNGLLNTNENVINSRLTHNSNDRPHYISVENGTDATLNIYNDQQTIETSIFLGSNPLTNLLISNDDSRAIVSSTNQINVINLTDASEP